MSSQNVSVAGTVNDHDSAHKQNGLLTSATDNNNASSHTILDPSSIVTLKLGLPDGRYIEDYECKAATSFSDVLVQVCAQNRLQPSQHVLIPENDGDPMTSYVEGMQCRPNNLVGLNKKRNFVIVPRERLIKNPDNYRAIKEKKSSVPKVEMTNRVLVHLPQQKRVVIRISLKESVRKVFDQVCAEKQLYPPDYVVCHPDTKEPLDMQRSLADYSILEILIERICQPSSGPVDSRTLPARSSASKEMQPARFKARSASKASAGAQFGDDVRHERGASYHGSSVSLAARGAHGESRGKKHSKINAFLTFLRIKKKKKKGVDTAASQENLASGPPPTFPPARGRPKFLTEGRPASAFVPPASTSEEIVAAREASAGQRPKKRRAPAPPPPSDQLGSQTAAGFSQSVPALPVMVAVELDLHEAPDAGPGPGDKEAEEEAPPARQEEEAEARKKHHSSHDTGFHSSGSNEVDLAAAEPPSQGPRKKTAAPRPPSPPGANEEDDDIWLRCLRKNTNTKRFIVDLHKTYVVQDRPQDVELVELSPAARLKSATIESLTSYSPKAVATADRSPSPTPPSTPAHSVEAIAAEARDSPLPAPRLKFAAVESRATFSAKAIATADRSPSPSPSPPPSPTSAHSVEAIATELHDSPAPAPRLKCATLESQATFSAKAVATADRSLSPSPSPTSEHSVEAIATELRHSPSPVPSPEPSPFLESAEAVHELDLAASHRPSLEAVVRNEVCLSPSPSLESAEAIHELDLAASHRPSLEAVVRNEVCLSPSPSLESAEAIHELDLAASHWPSLEPAEAVVPSPSASAESSEASRGSPSPSAESAERLRRRVAALAFAPQAESEEEAQLEVKFVPPPVCRDLEPRMAAPTPRPNPQAHREERRLVRSMAEIRLASPPPLAVDSEPRPDQRMMPSTMNSSTATLVDSEVRTDSDLPSRRSDSASSTARRPQSPAWTTSSGGSIFLRATDRRRESGDVDPAILELEQQLDAWRQQLHLNQRRLERPSVSPDPAQEGLMQQQIQLQQALMEQMERNILNLKAKRASSEPPGDAASSPSAVSFDRATEPPPAHVAPRIVRQRDHHRDDAKPIFDSRVHLRRGSDSAPPPPDARPTAMSARAARMAARAERRSESTTRSDEV